MEADKIIKLWNDCEQTPTDGYALKFARALLASVAPQVVADEHATTPGATWRVNGEPDPHGTHYDGERAALCMGSLTDDQLANAAFMNYDVNPSIADMLAGKAFRPIIYMTAVKERIRWLSRALVKATAALAAVPAKAQEPAENENDIAISAKRFLACVNERKDAEISFTTAEGHTEFDRARSQLQKSLAGRAPAQPVAVPDGWCQFIDGVKTQNVARDMKELDTIKSIFKVMAPVGAKAEYRPFYFAAPAAQGDAKSIVDIVTAVMSKHGLIDSLGERETQAFCDGLHAAIYASNGVKS